MTSRTVAVIGAGISGLTAAHLLARTHEVTLYEAEPRLGGHAHTHDVTDLGGATHAVDTGFIVHNERTYPLLLRLFRELGVATRPTEMSMSIHDEATGIAYAGGRGAGGVLAQPGRLLDPRFLAVLAHVPRFHRRAREHLATTDDLDPTTYRDFLHRHRFPGTFVRLYAVPLVSCVWSMGRGAALDYPARYLFRFLAHHGMLAINGSPQWRTVVGGSRRYVDAIAARLPDVRAGHPVVAVHRSADEVRVRDASGHESFHDAVVLATHADQALGLLADATPDEKEVLGAFRYSRSRTVLHTDARWLPAARRAQASWNYRIAAGPAGGDGTGAGDVPVAGDHPPVVTYWMNRLQGLDSATPYLVTLNADRPIDPAYVLAEMDYEHPIYDLATVRAQRRLPSLTSPTTVFAGAYHGWGFHEDGCRSGVEAAAALGTTWEG